MNRQDNNGGISSKKLITFKLNKGAKKYDISTYIDGFYTNVRI